MGTTGGADQNRYESASLLSGTFWSITAFMIDVNPNATTNPMASRITDKAITSPARKEKIKQQKLVFNISNKKKTG